MNVLLGVLAVGIGVAIILVRARFVDAGEASHAARRKKPQDSGHVRLRRAYNRAIVVLTGCFFVLMGVLNIVGVTHWINK